MVDRLNRHCAYFPCHKPEGGGLASNSQSHKALEDCTFCYCPFYPCKDARLGKYILTKDQRKVWSCQDCSWIHKKKVVDRILKLIKAKSMRPHQASLKLKYKHTGIIILGHGCRLKKANSTIQKIIRRIKKDNGIQTIEPAYLQLCKPTLHTSVAKIIKKGCKRVVIVPFFLFIGNHVSRDMPRLIKKEAGLFKQIDFICAKNIGQDKRIGDIVWDCIKNENSRPPKNRR